MIRTRCPGCEKTLSVKDEVVGQTISCPICRTKVKVVGDAAQPARDEERITASRKPAPHIHDAYLDRDLPARHRRRPEDEEEDRRARSRDDERRRRLRRSPSFLRGEVIVLLIIAAMSLTLVGLCFAFPQLTGKAMIACSVISGLGGLWLMGVAFQENTLHGIAYLVCSLAYSFITWFVPFGGLFSLFFPNVYGAMFTVLHFDEAKKPFFVHALGSFLLLVLFLRVIDLAEQRPAASPVASGAPSKAAIERPPWRPVDRPSEKPAEKPLEKPSAEPPIEKPPIEKPPVETVKMKKPWPAWTPPSRAPRAMPPDLGAAKTGLRAHWTFDEGKGNKAVDSGPYKLEAVLHGSTWAPGVRGSAVQLNGADFVELSPAPILSFAANTPFTIAGWVKTAYAGGMVLSLRPEKDAPYDMINLTLRDGKLVVQIRHTGNPGYPDEAIAAAPVADDTWHHFAIRRTPDGTVSLYQDGKLSSGPGRFGRTASQPGRIITSNRGLGIEAMLLTGQRHPAYDYTPYVGCIDELCFYGSALEEADLAKLMKIE